MLGYRGPAVVIDAAIAEDLEVLRLMPPRRFGIVERVTHAHAFDRILPNAVDGFRLRKTGALQDGGRDVDDVAKLRARFAFGLKSVRPTNDRAVTRAAPM